MRIALIVHKFPPTSLGGTEIYTRNLAHALSERHDVFVFYRYDNETRFHEGWEAREGFRAWRVGRAFDAGKTNPLALFLDTFYNRDVEDSFDRFLDDVQPDLVHFQHLMLLSYRLIAQAKARGLPSLLTLHDYWFICSNSQLIWPDGQICRGKAWGMNCAPCATARIGRPWMVAARPVIAAAIRLRDLLVRRAALQAGRLIAPSGFLIDRYVAAGFPRQRFRLLENGLDVDRIRSHPGSPSHDDRLRVTYLGSLAWQKGVHVLVDAFRDLAPDQVVLRVFGNPDTFPEYSANLRRRANPSNTRFEGPVPNEQVGHVLAETDILAVPSLWYENSPVVIQEARAAGVPVIASAHGALVEKVRDGIDGLLVRPGDVTSWEGAFHTLISTRRIVEHLQENVPAPTPLRKHAEYLENLYRRGIDERPSAC